MAIMVRGGTTDKTKGLPAGKKTENRILSLCHDECSVHCNM